MRLDDEQESSNFEIQRGGGMGRGFGGGAGGGNLLGLLLPLIGSKFGCWGIAIVVVLMLVMGGGGGLSSLLGGLTGGGTSISPQQQTQQADPGELTDIQRISLKVLGSTERRWQDIFAANGSEYPAPTLVFYDRNGMSGCGAAQSAMGPFYCPADQKIYIDTTFFNDMKNKMGIPGDFPIGYVIAHEVGHHIQTITGTANKVRQAQQRASQEEGNALQVRMELQADCYAGVWAARDTNLMEPGDMEEGLRAAHQIGDDTLMKAAGRRPVESMFTHGSAEQRMAWLKRGLQTGNPASCDTFSQDL